MSQILAAGVFTLLISFPLFCTAETKIVVKGLFKGAALLEINGRSMLLKQGKRSDEGVFLVSASSKEALVEVEGKRKVLKLSQGIGAAYSEASTNEVRLSSQHHGHFFGTAKFNGRSAQFLVDTGASSISMSSALAERLGIKYKNGRSVRVTTAEGTTQGFQISLKRVEVGAIRVNNVEAIVIEGEYPLDVLLGNSFLSKTDMNIQNGVLVLKTKY